MVARCSFCKQILNCCSPICCHLRPCKCRNRFCRIESSWFSCWRSHLNHSTRSCFAANSNCSAASTCPPFLLWCRPRSTALSTCLPTLTRPHPKAADSLLHSSAYCWQVIDTQRISLKKKIKEYLNQPNPMRYMVNSYFFQTLRVLIKNWSSIF